LNLPYADLHVHTLYSDGTLTPLEVYDAAVKNGVGLLAIADHDILEGSSRLKTLCFNSPVKYISAVEIDAFDHGENIHILAYGADFSDAEFIRFIEQTREKLDGASDRLIARMQQTILGISIQDYREFSYLANGGGWKALHYLKARGLTQTLTEGFKFYPQFGCNHEENGYASVCEVCSVIHAAGGKAVLAHPGQYRFNEPLATVLAQVFGDGIDGVECYYPKHTDVVTKTCLRFCEQNNLMITAGSDCHGAFTGSPVGATKTLISALQLGNLLEKNT